MLSKYCEASGLTPDKPGIDKWQPGKIKEWEVWEGWHDDAEQSTGLI